MTHNTEANKSDIRENEASEREVRSSVSRKRVANLRTPEVDDLLAVLAATNNEDDLFALLEDLFTIREIRESSQRLAVAKLLDKGNSYAKVEQATGASATTIARVSKCLSYGTGGYHAALKKLQQKEEQ